MGSARLTELLTKLRGRVLAVSSASGFGWGLALAWALLLAGAWVDLVWELSAGTRVAVLLLALSALAASIGWFFWKGCSQLQPLDLARRLDQVAGSGGQILSGVDLLQGGLFLTPFSAALATVAVERAAEVATQVDTHRAVPAKPVRWSFGTVGALFAAAALLSLIMPRLAWTQWLRFADPYGDHPPFSRVVFHVEPGDVKVVYGTALEVRVTTSGPPVENVQLTLQTAGEGDALPMFPSAQNQWTASVASVTSPGQYFIRADGARSRRFRLDVVTVPRIEAVRFRVTPPAYTNLSPYEGPLPHGGLAGLPGTRVQVTVKSNRPLSGGTLDLIASQGRSQTQLVSLAPRSREVTGTFEIRAPGRMNVRVMDVDGTSSQEEFWAPITVLADERPFIRLVEPPPVSFATPNVDLPVIVSAEDDFGISRIQLFRSLNDSQPVPVEVAVDGLPPRRWTATLSLPLSTYGLAPGDVIKLFARVEDNDPAGSKGFESSLARVQIISQQDFERMVRQREGLEVLVSKYQQAERRMEGLAEELAKLEKELADLPSESELAEAKREELNKLSERMQQEANAIREAAKHTMPYELDQNLTEQLQKMAEAIEEAGTATRQLAASPKVTAGEAKQELKKRRERLQQQRQQFQQDAMQPLERLAQAYPLLEDEARFVELYQRQRELEERLASLKGQDAEKDPKLKSRMRDLEEEQRENREALSELLHDIEDHAARLPDTPDLAALKESAVEFASAVRSSGAVEAMANAEFSLAEFAGGPGHAAAKEAADILEKFLGRCAGMGEEGGQCLKRFSPSLGQCMSNTANQLLAEAGFGSKQGYGMGEGAGGGYSSRRSTLQNVGMYGQLPALGQTSRSGFGASRMGAAGRGDSLRNPDSGSPTSVQSAGELQASGAGASAVPLKYRRRVSQYFQRIVDETGGKP